MRIIHEYSDVFHEVSDERRDEAQVVETYFVVVRVGAVRHTAAVRPERLHQSKQALPFALTTTKRNRSVPRIRRSIRYPWMYLA